MPVVAQTQFYKSWLQVGSVFLPAYPNSLRLICPRGYVVPPIIGNYWQWSYGVGLRQPMLEVQLAVRDVANEVMGSTTFLNYFHARTTTADHDAVAIGTPGIRFWNGVRGFKMVGGVKADSYTFGTSTGAELRFTARFVGTDYTPFTGAEVTAAPTLFSGWSASNLMTWANCTFGKITGAANDGAYNGAFWNFNASFSNNMSPDMGMNGTQFVNAQNAGMQSAGLSVLTQAAAMVGAPSLLANIVANGSFPAPATPTNIGVSVVGATAGTRIFTFNNPVLQDDDNLSADAPRVMQQLSLMCLGGDGYTIPPLVVT